MRLLHPLVGYIFSEMGIMYTEKTCYAHVGFHESRLQVSNPDIDLVITEDFVAFPIPLNNKEYVNTSDSRLQIATLKSCLYLEELHLRKH